MTGYVRINDFIKLSPKSLCNLLSRVNRVYRDFVPIATNPRGLYPRLVGGFIFSKFFLRSSK